MAYAKLANMPVVYGLYMNVVPTLIYAIFGTSKHASIGAATVLSLMMGALKNKILPCDDCWISGAKNFSTLNETPIFLDNKVDDKNSLSAIDVGAANAFFVGMTLIIMGFLRLDILSTYLSDQIVGGFTVGAGVHIFSAQIGSAFGLSLPKCQGPFCLILEYADFFRAIDQANIVSTMICWTSVIFLLIMKLGVNPWLLPKTRIILPAELVVVVLGCIISSTMDLNSKHDVQIVGYIPASFPLPTFPRFELFKEIILDSVIIALVTYCQSISQAKLYARIHSYEIDNRQELFAYGIMNCIGSFFQCYNSGFSVSRTIVYERSGAKSQLAAVFGVLIVVFSILFVASYLKVLPQSVLASIIIVACVDLFRQLKEVKVLWQTSRYDLAVYLITIFAIILLDFTYGLLTSVGFALFSVILRTQCKSVKEISGGSRISNGDCNQVQNNNDGIPSDVKIFRFCAPLYYANVENFRYQLMKKCLRRTASAEKIITKVKGISTVQNRNGVDLNKRSDRPIIRHVIIDCSGFTYLDLMGVDVLKRVYSEFKDQNVKVWFAQFNGKYLKRYHWLANLSGM
uniref:STAS domain-containing protein n=1 Tax=Romanomermis culicivorax TaxID=13658 RepID=A0A915J185_ROMCU